MYSELQALDDSYLKIKIQRMLKATLRRPSQLPLLYWLTTEYTAHTETRGKHLNGEILLYPNELKKCEMAFEKLFGLHDIDPITKKPILNADGTIKQKKGRRFAIDFPIKSRNDQIRMRGGSFMQFTTGHRMP